MSWICLPKSLCEKMSDFVLQLAHGAVSSRFGTTWLCLRSQRTKAGMVHQSYFGSGATSRSVLTCRDSGSGVPDAPGQRKERSWVDLICLGTDWGGLRQTTEGVKEGTHDREIPRSSNCWRVAQTVRCWSYYNHGSEDLIQVPCLHLVDLGLRRLQRGHDRRCNDARKSRVVANTSCWTTLSLLFGRRGLSVPRLASVHAGFVEVFAICHAP